MQADRSFAPEAWLLPYNDGDPGLSSERAVSHRALLEAESVPYVEWCPALVLGAGHFDVAVFTHPYDRERPQPLWFQNVRRCVDMTVYIPYGLTVGAGAKNLRLQFAQPLQIGADLIVARSLGEKAMYAKYCPRGDEHVQVLGHPRFDHMLQAVQSCIESDLMARVGDRVAFLWNSHFSFGHRYSQSSNFSTFDLLGPEIFEYFVARRDELCLIWRPHPALFPALIEQRVIQAEQLPALRRELQMLGIVLDEMPGHLPVFACSHAMLSDPGSFLFDYLAMQRPLLVLLNPEGEPLNEEANALVRASGAATSMVQVQAFVDAVINGRIDAGALAERRTRFLPQADGHSAQRICAAISPAPIEVGAGAWGMQERTMVFPVLTRPLHPQSLQDVAMPPVLAAMMAGLRSIRAEKMAEGLMRKRVRRALNLGRIWLGENIKQSAALMAAVSRLRRRRS